MERINNMTLDEAMQICYRWQLRNAIVFDDFRVSQAHDNRVVLTAGPRRPGCLFLLADEHDSQDASYAAVRIYGDSDDLEHKLKAALVGANDNWLLCEIERLYDLSQDKPDDELKKRRFEHLRLHNKGLNVQDISERGNSRSTVQKDLMLMKALQNLAEKGT